ncbi:RNA helicase, partial [Exiguobacterium mexicanum]
MIVLLDEFQQADPESVLTGVYQLGNGTSKLRATKNANLQQQFHWSIIGLSTGEISLAQVLAQANRKVQAGQLMRFFEIPLFQKYGAFDDIHGFPSAKEFAEHISQ